MVKRYVIGMFAALLLLQGCKSTDKPTVENTKYKRKPITEVSQEQLNNDVLLIEAKTQSELGNNEQAAEIYHRLLKQDSGYAVAYFELGGMFYVAGMMDSAAFYTEKAYGISPKNVWYKLQLADIYKKLRRFDDAAKVSEELVAEHPEVLEYYYELANVYLADNKVENAIDVFNRLEKRVGVSEEVSLQKQRLWEMINRHDKAIKEIEQLAKAYPNEKKYNSILAELFMSKKEYDKAYSYYRKVLETDPNDEYIHISLANYYKLTNQPQKAYEELKKGFMNDGLSSKEKTQILTSFYTAEEFYGNYSKYAYELVDIIMKNNPDSLSLSLFYGDVLMRQGKYKEAAYQLNNYIRIDSSEFDIWEALLMCESEIENNDDRLLNLCGRVINLFPTHPLPYYLKGFITYQKRDYKEAIKTLQEGEKWVGNNQHLAPEFWAILGECFYRINDYESCYKYYDKYLEKKPVEMGILNNYAYYLSERNEKLEKAEQMSKITIEAEPKNPTFLDTYGWIMFKMGRYKDAETYIRRAIDNDKEPSATLYEHYGDTMYKLNKPDEAKKYWQKALGVNDENINTDSLKHKLKNGIE